MDLVTQDNYEKRPKQTTIPPVHAKEKEIKEPIQKRQPGNKNKSPKNIEIITKNNICGFCGQQIWSPQHKYPAQTVECNNCHK